MKLAHEAYKRMIENKVEPGRYGYRSYKHLMYYVYALFRKYVETIGHSPKWLIYEGGYNAVMNLDRGSDSWVKAKELPRVEWYFEFNDDIFHLKLHQQSEDSEAVSKWVDRCVKEMTNIDNARGMGTQFKRSSSWKKGWPSIAHWNTNFMDFEILHREINSIINSFGSNGVLGQL